MNTFGKSNQNIRSCGFQNPLKNIKMKKRKHPAEKIYQIKLRLKEPWIPAMQAEYIVRNSMYFQFMQSEYSLTFLKAIFKTAKPI